MPIDDLPPLREVVARHAIAAQKRLGQNFLFDLNLTMKIARAAGDLTGTQVIEIGAGPGGLTRALLAAGARHVIAIERDPRCLPALEEIAAHYPGRLTIRAEDALEAPYAALVDGAPTQIIANLPYNIGTALLLQWLCAEPWPPWYSALTLMFQREVADRIVAGPEDPANFGRLGVLCGWRAEAKILFDVPAAAFSPPPKVTSSVVRLTPRAAPLPCRRETLERVTAQTFGQKRKMLRQSLKAFGEGADLASAAGIDPTRRPETLSIAEFVALANALEARKAPAPPAAS